jgi:hypothetical protein
VLVAPGSPKPAARTWTCSETTADIRSVTASGRGPPHLDVAHSRVERDCVRSNGVRPGLDVRKPEATVRRRCHHANRIAHPIEQRDSGPRQRDPVRTSDEAIDNCKLQLRVRRQ